MKKKSVSTKGKAVKSASKKLGFGLSSRAKRSRPQPINYMLSAVAANPGLISLAAGLVDYETLPTEHIAELVGEVMKTPKSSQLAMQYGSTEGLTQLRQALLEHLASLDDVAVDHWKADAGNIVVTNGSQQLLFILADVLVDPGDIVITAWPSYFVYTCVLESLGANVRCLEMDENGILPDSLEALLTDLEQAGQLPKVKIVYVTSYHQNPTGITLSADRRERMLEIVKKFSKHHRILLIEDAAYRELTFEGQAPPSIKKYDRDNKYVALLQTFSKPFAPGFKTGYGLLPSDLVEAVLNQKGNQDFGSANLCQHMLYAAISKGLYHKHVDVLRKNYKKKAHAMLDALNKHLGDFFPGKTHWTIPLGGLYVYLKLPKNIDTGVKGKLFKKALAEGVMYVPGEFCYGPDPARKIPNNMMRLTFGVAGIKEIQEGVARLAKAIKAVAAGK
jgi:2-aminoadipate transaminase